MKRIDFNQDWTCKGLTRDTGEIPVTLPHDAMISEPRNLTSRGEGNIGWYVGGDYEYRKVFTAPGEWKGQKVLLEFEGVYREAEVYVNGEKAAFRPYGYTNFYVDVTDRLKYGEENEIRVLAKNADQPNSRWYSGTGIYRPVWAWIGGEKHIPVNGVRIRTLAYQPAQIEIRIKTSCPGEVKVEILDEDQVVAAQTVPAKAGVSKKTGEGGAALRIYVPDAKLWDCNTPNLYTCRVTFGDDVVEGTFGIRLLEWNSQVGFAINGKRLIIRGACIHHDNGLLGACAFPEAEERRVRILKESGYNALRSAHNPCSKAILDACDRQGMLMMDEYVDVWYIHKTRYDYASEMTEWWKKDLKDMVDKDYNHPCVILYSTGNEVSETAQEKGIKLAGELTRFLHRADGTRLVTCGINIFFNFLSSIGLGVYSDDKAEKEAENAEKEAAEAAGNAPEKKRHVGSDFYNTLATVMGDYFMKVGAALPFCDWKTRGAYANMDIAGYNYGIFRYEHDLKEYPNRLILGSETFAKDAMLFWEKAKLNNRIIGDFVWTGMDYIGETGDGPAEYADYKSEDPSTRMTGGNGRVDLIGRRRTEAAFTLVAFEQETGPFLAVNPVYEDEKLQLTGWQITKGLESWSWRGCAGKKATVEVFARADSVELLVNGQSVGRQKMKKGKCRMTFRTPYQDGEITAVSYDENGQEIARQTLKTAGEETKLRVEPEESAVKPDGLCFIDLRYTDAEGIWKPMEKHTLGVTVENGKLAGLGSADPYVKGNYTDDTVKTYFGEAMAIVRADGSGPVKVTVADETNNITIEIPLEKCIS